MKENNNMEWKKWREKESYKLSKLSLNKEPIVGIRYMLLVLFWSLFLPLTWKVLQPPNPVV